MSKRTRNLVILILVALITIGLLAFGMLGFRYGINVIVPMRSAIKRGMDYGVGRTTVYQFADEAKRNSDNQTKSLEAMKRRLDILEMSGVRLYAQGEDKIRIDIPRKQHFYTTSETGLQEEILDFVSTQAFFYLKEEESGEEIFNSNNVTHTEVVTMPVQTDQGVSYSYGVLIHLDEAGTEKLAAVTADAGLDEDTIIVDFGYDDNSVARLSVTEQIVDGQVIIRNNFGAESAGRLASLIDSGPLASTMEQVDHYDGDPMQGSGVFARITNGVGIGLLVIIAAWILLYKSSGLMASLSMAFVTFIFLLGFSTIEQVLITPAGLAGALAGLALAVGFHFQWLENLNGDIYADQEVSASIKTAFRKGVAPMLDTMIPLFIAGIVGMLFGGEMMEDFCIPMMIGGAFAIIGYFFCGGMLWLMAGVDGKQGHYKRLGTAVSPGAARSGKAVV